MEKHKFNINYIIAISLVSAMGGLLFGYDWVVIGGAKPFYERFFEIASFPVLQGWAMSSALVGCIFGAIIAGVFSDRYGRKPVLVLSATLFLASALGTGMANNFTIFILFRLLGGIGIGLASTISPIYIAEIAPAAYRGRLVSLNQLTIVIGILAAQIMNYLIAYPVPLEITDEMIANSWNGQHGWRWMFWAEAVPALMFFAFMFLVPESPRWLAKNNNWDKTEKILNRLGDKSYVQSSIKGIKSSLKDAPSKFSFKQLKDVKLRPILLLGIVLAAFQQWSGINVVYNYAEEIFTAAGYGVSDMLFNIVITGIVNLLFTFVAIRTVDKWGRRKLMLFGSLGLAITYIFLGASYYFELEGFIVLIFVILGIAVYAMSLAPITWVVLSEIFPNRVRGMAMSIATTTLWIACFILTFIFPILNYVLGTYGTFWLFAVVCVLGFFFIKARLVETKGKSLEEVEIMLTSKKK